MASGMFFDLQREVTTNHEFIEKVASQERIIQSAFLDDDEELKRSAMTELVRMCDYNPSLLIPYYFPMFTKGQPMTLWSRPHAISMMSFVPTGSLVVQASRQIGKCCAGDTAVTVRVKGGTVRNVGLADLFEEAKSKE